MKAQATEPMKSSGLWAESAGKHPLEKEAPVTGDPCLYFAMKGDAVTGEGGAFLSISQELRLLTKHPRLGL